MNHSNNNIKNKFGKHLSLCERKEIERSFKMGYSIRSIAKALNRSPSTISREIARGTVTQVRVQKRSLKRNNYKEEIIKEYYNEYFADTGQMIARSNIGKRGGKYKIFKDPKLVAFIEDSILIGKQSPDAITGYLKLNKHKFTTTVCTKTIYNYIDRSLIGVKNIDLLLKVSRNTKKDRIRKHKRIFGQSIDLRPESVNNREEFGHYEGDSIVGKGGKSSALTIVERKTRKGFIIEVKDRGEEAAYETLKEFIKELPAQAVKSITFDNGSEFAKCHELNGVEVYYAHPYSSYERGSNEHYNGIIRRFIPKGKDLSLLNQNDLNRINNWIDDYPRKILGYKTASDCFKEELEKILFPLGGTVADTT